MTDVDEVRLSPADLARVESVAAGLLPPTSFALTATTADPLRLLDPEGVERGRVVAGTLVVGGQPTAATYLPLRHTADALRAVGARTAVLAAEAPEPDAVAAAVRSGPVLLLAATGAARADDAAHHRAVRGWQRLATALATALDERAVLAVTPLPADLPPDERAEVAAGLGVRLLDLPPAAPAERTVGAVVMLSGLSGSGKSTIAAALVALLTEQRGRTVTALDGDVVRTHLSRELGFSKADRDTNIRRIGWVGAEIAKHGGIAVLAPIAPYAATRAAVRTLVDEQAGPGAFVLVHVATSLEECERRDRKGLYAKARAGLIPEFTGISDPYEEPLDAEIVIDTVTTSPAAAAQTIADHLELLGRL